VLLPRAALEDVGLFDETLWLYCEDQDLGWRLRLRGYRNLLAPRSVCRHHYEFSRSTAKWYWLERNRWLVMLKNYHAATFALLLPWLVVGDLGIVLLAVKGGWWRQKLRAMSTVLRPEIWRYLAREHRRVQRTRRASEREVLAHMTPLLSHAELDGPLLSLLIEPVWRLLFAGLKEVVRW
jgi:GT2 family glycosyltransferase